MRLSLITNIYILGLILNLKNIYEFYDCYFHDKNIYILFSYLLKKIQNYYKYNQKKLNYIFDINKNINFM